MPQRVYAHKKAKTSHLLNDSTSPNSGDSALCGASPRNFWWGTGSWEETEKVRTLPLCKKCAAKQ